MIKGLKQNTFSISYFWRSFRYIHIGILVGLSKFGCFKIYNLLLYTTYIWRCVHWLFVQYNISQISKN